MDGGARLDLEHCHEAHSRESVELRRREEGRGGGELSFYRLMINLVLFSSRGRRRHRLVSRGRTEKHDREIKRDEGEGGE